MQVSLLTRHDEVIAVLNGDLTMTTLDDVLPVFVDISDAPEQNVCVDLSGVPTIDAAAIGLLIALNQRLRAAGHDLTVFCPPGQPRGLIAMIGLDQDVRVIDWSNGGSNPGQPGVLYH
ncbi:STAS domain-containing protein [Novispirillum itersonii]|uniref:STAS domain-containing protein n=1 Tax=Novispirillum itersonii TaxID=189 RepID=UPI000360D719|nr:STAS domain-containing protein [Novispirillum itersonii]